ncbi:MAG: hypothetical protein K6U74_13530, partial [Firmicutes bacterium]|nr:hypothetical protein [Bacillota bacterium]
IPVIISSCLSERTLGLAMGANEYLVKPFEPKRLVEIVNSLVNLQGNDRPLMIAPDHPNVREWLLKRLQEKGLAVKDIISERDAIFVVVEKNY